MIEDNGMQSSGKNASTHWAYNIRAALTVLFFVILPWQTRWIYRASPIHPDAEWGRLSLYASELLLGVFLVWAFVRLFVQSRRKEFKKQPLSIERWWLVGALFVIVYGFARAAFSVDPSAGFQHTWWLMEAVLIVVFLRIGWFPWRAAVAGLCVGLSIAALLGIYQAVGQYAPGNKWLGLAEHLPEWGGSSVVENADGRFLRAYGPLPHPNIMGGHMATSLFLLWILVTHGEYMRRLSIATLLMSGALALSFSRGAWIAWVAALIIALYQQQRAVLGRVLLSVLTMVVVLITLWPITITRFTADARLEQRAVDERVMSIHDGITAWKQAPWFGVGPAQYMNTFFVQQRDTKWWQLAPPHNVFIALLVEYGLVGALLVIVTCVLFLLYIVRRGGYRLLWWFLPLLVLMQFDHYIWSLYSGVILLATYLGFCAHFVHNIHTVDTHEHY